MRVWPRAAAVAALGVALAGCSNSSRFDQPYPTASRQMPARGEVTGSIAQRPTPSAPIASRPITSQPLPTPPQTVAAGTGYSSGSQGLGAYRPTQRYGDVTGSVTTPQQPSGHWTWDGGHPVTVGQGESVDVIARRQGVPVSAILSTNGITDPSQVRPGQRLVIPRYVSSAGQTQPAPQVAAPQTAMPSYIPAAAPAQPARPSGENVHVVAPGESLIGLSRRYGMTLTDLARHNGISPYTRLSVGDRVKVPGSRQTVAQAPRMAGPQVQAQAQAQPQRYAATTPQPQIAKPQTSAQGTWPYNTAPQTTQPRTIPIERTASAEPTQSVRMVSQETPKADVAPEKVAEPAGSLQSFRWPVHGRVIAGFGSRPNGTQNDGINIAVPEGTQVKAADDGVVAYAGNELKGYGNLVLVRHSNGYVSAYANASELLVKRGDTIKRGQVIALSGQTGNVTSPQLHFEIRKGSTPVDPTKYLASN